MESVVYRDAYALLAFAHAKCAAELYLVTETVFRDKMLKLFYHVA